MIIQSFKAASDCSLMYLLFLHRRTMMHLLFERHWDLMFSCIASALIWQVVPMENVNGRKLVEDGELCERRNGIVADTTVFIVKFCISFGACVKIWDLRFFQEEELISTGTGVWIGEKRRRYVNSLFVGKGYAYNNRVYLCQIWCTFWAYFFTFPFF